ncbi:hypothetical protein NL50_04135 [Clostridium acetobutylicum]|nr:hypothetical protein NL50_04135 [Clostridium acetobutylicum]
MKKVIKFLTIMVLVIEVIIVRPYTVRAESNGVILDGYYDDWTDKPYAEIKYDWESPGQVHIVKWYSDDKNLYLHIKMGVTGGQQINHYIIYFNVDNGEKKQLQFSPDSPTTGRVSVFDANGGYTKISDDGYVTRGSNSDGKTSDEAEFRIPLSEFQKDSGKMFTLNLQFPNLGYQQIVFQVGSTYPYMGIAMSSSVAAFGFYFYRRKRRKLI